MKRVLKLGRAIYCWVLGGCEVSLTAEQRITICKNCEHYSEGRCKICGCVLKYKTQMETEKCPIDKW